MWLAHIQTKAHHFKAAAQYRQARFCLNENKYGEEIARLQLANSYIKRAMDGGSFKKASTYVQQDIKVSFRIF